ncbi:MAG: CvpA family protein, partial [Actinobacteria bacterium]|nr:CvpA family protein [Actinomycetota bacterium]
MLAVDIVAIVLLLAGAFWGVRRGLVTNFFTVLGLFVGGFTLYWVIPPLGAVLPWPVLRAAVLGGTAAAVFMVTWIVGGRFGLFLRRHLDHTQFRLPDRILGGV